MEQVKIKPDKLAGSISRISESITRSKYQGDKESLPHAWLSAGIGLGISSLVSIASYLILSQSMEFYDAILLTIIIIIPVVFLSASVAQIYFLWKELEHTVYRITPEGVEIENNYLDQELKRINFGRITDTQMERTLLLRFFGKGNVRLNSAGSDSYEAILKYIDSPELVNKHISGMISNTREVNPSTGKIEENKDVNLDQEEILKPDLKSAMVSSFALSLILAPLLGATVGATIWLKGGEALAVPAALIAIAIIFPSNLIRRYYNLKNTEYRFKRDHVEVYEGFWNIKEENVPYSRITDVTLSKPLLQRAFGTGSILLNTAGSDIPKGSIDFIENPDEKHEKIKKLLNQ